MTQTKHQIVLFSLFKQLVFGLLLITAPFINASENINLAYLKKARAIVEDNQGYIWIAGHQGLTRYDGNNSINFSSTSENWQLPFSWIHDLYVDGDNLLLATETHQLWQFNTKNTSITPIKLEIDKKATYHTAKLGDYYFLDIDNKLYQRKPASEFTKVIAENLHIKSLQVANNTLFIASRKGLFKFKSGQSQVTPVLNEEVFTVTPVAEGLIAVTADSIHFISNQEKIKSIEINESVYASTWIKGTNQFFVLTSQGKFLKYDAHSLALLSHQYPEIEPIRARQIMHDSSGVIWVTSNRGISKVTEINVKNHPFYFDVASNSIELVLFNSRLLLGSYGQGIYNFNPDSRYFPPELNNLFGRKEKRIMDLVSYKDSLYIATFSGIWQYNAETKQLKKIISELQNDILIKLSINKDKLYIATNDRGLFIYNLRTDSLINHIAPQNGLSSPEVIDIHVQNDNTLWAATAAGVDIIQPFSNQIKNIPLPTKNKVMSLKFLDNKIFASTKGEGIFVFNLQGEILARFAIGIDFSRMSVINEKLWVAAQHGLYRITPKDYHVSLIPNTEQYSFSDAPLLIDNKIYAPHFGGVLEVPTEQDHFFNPNVFISKINVSGKESLFNKTIKVSSSNDIITLNLASLDYRPGNGKQYKYQINDGSWQQLSGNQLTLTGLASGRYRLNIMATNSLGHWSNKQAFANINVEYPWFWTPQIRIVYAFIVIAIIVLTLWLGYLRAKSIGHIYKILTDDVKKRGKVLLTINQKLSVAMEMLDKTESIKNNSTKDEIKTLIKQSLTELNNDLSTKEPDTLYGNSLSVALPYLSEYIYKKYHITVDNKFDYDEQKLAIELQADIYKIIYEAITSAILTSNGRNFSITIKEIHEKLWLSIADDNDSFVHFDSKINFDLASYYIRQIAKKHNAIINTFEEHEDGSMLAISFPLSQLSNTTA